MAVIELVRFQIIPKFKRNDFNILSFVETLYSWTELIFGKA